MKAKPGGPGKKLRDIQRAFASATMRPLTTDYGMQSTWFDGTSTSKAVATFIAPNDRLSSFERIEIYNKQYWFRLLDSLWEDFPGLRTLMGDARFHQMSIAYLQKFPSKSYALGALGCRLEKFLSQEPEWVAAHPVLARDVVRLEWAHIRAFDADEHPPLEINALLDGGGDTDSLRLDLQPHLTFLACDYAVDEFVIAAKRRSEPKGEASNAVAEHLPRAKTRKLKLPKPEKVCLAVHRSDFSVWYKRLEPGAYEVLAALKKGMPLQGACERALRRSKGDPDFGSKLQTWFAQWASFGWFCRVSDAPPAQA